MPNLLVSEKKALEAFQNFSRHKAGAKLEVQYDENQFVLRVSPQHKSVVDETAGTLKIDKKVLREILEGENFYEV